MKRLGHSVRTMKEKNSQTLESATLQRKGAVRACVVCGDILYFQFDGPIVDADAVQCSQELREELVGDTPFLCLTDLRSVARSTPEARQTKAEGNIRGLALLYSSPVGRMIGNAYLRLRRTECPVKLFADPEDALAWLEKGRDSFTAQASEST